MAVGISTYSLFVLLLSPLLLTGAGADMVTWSQCKDDIDWLRVTRLPDRAATRLYLSFCNIPEIHSNAFDGLPNLEIIAAESCEIVTLDGAAFRTVTNLTYLFLAHNKLTEVPIFNERLPNLKVLDFRFNRINHLNDKTFSGCSKLQYLYLDHNLIEYIHPDVFQPLKELEFLYLHNNKITHIPDAMFINVKKLNVLQMSNNLISRLTSNFISEIKRVGVNFNEFYFDHNPWRCVSLMRILKDAKRTGVKYYPTNLPPYDGKRPVCVLM